MELNWVLSRCRILSILSWRVSAIHSEYRSLKSSPSSEIMLATIDWTVSEDSDRELVGSLWRDFESFFMGMVNAGGPKSRSSDSVLWSALWWSLDVLRRKVVSDSPNLFSWSSEEMWFSAVVEDVWEGSITLVASLWTARWSGSTVLWKDRD